MEYDPISVYLESSESAIDGADPPATQTVNAAISLFASVLPLQPPKVQESSLEQLALLQSRPYSREPGRKAALQLNIATAILLALTVANRETNFSSGKLAASSVEKGMAAIVQVRRQFQPRRILAEGNRNLSFMKTHSSEILAWKVLLKCVICVDRPSQTFMCGN